MKNLFATNEKCKSAIVSKMLIGALTLAFVAGLGIVTRADAAASRNATKELLLSEMSLFNPFTLQSTSTKIGFFRDMDRSQPRALPLQMATAPALGEGDADAAGNWLWAPTHYPDEPKIVESGTEGALGPTVLLGIGTTSRPPIRIPYRPSLRSPFRPPL